MAERRFEFVARFQRFKALAPLLGLALVGLFLTRFPGRKIEGRFLLALAATLLIAGLIHPPLLKKLERLGKVLGEIVGIGLTWILLTPVYFLVFTTGRLFLILFRKDPLRRRFPSPEPTDWIVRAASDSSSFENQY